MRKTIIVALLMGGAWLFQGSKAYGQATSQSGVSADSQASLDQDVALLRKDLRSQKKQLIAANLLLTDAESTKFWPVYDQYAADLSKLGDEKYALIKEYAQGYGSLTDEQALSLMNRALALDEKIVQLRIKYVPIISKILPGTKTATFFQLDRRISTLMDLQLAKEIPLVQSQN